MAALSSSSYLFIHNCNSSLPPLKHLQFQSKISASSSSAKASQRHDVVSGNLHKKQSIHKLLNDHIHDYLDPPIQPAYHPDRVLSGNFAPVGEFPPTICTDVEGTIPASLRGTYIRNGPNPQFIPRGPYHLFDGDGMLHAVTFNGRDNNSAVVFCSRFVKTHKYELEREIGCSVLPSFLSSFNGALTSIARVVQVLALVLAGKFDIGRGYGVANTSLFQFGGKLFALYEYDFPYMVEITSDGDLTTVGPKNFSGGNGPLTAMTAHPKIDPKSGEVFAFRYSISCPFLVYFRINSEGTEQIEIPISSLKECSLIHDFAITENYAVFPDTQLKIRPSEILKGRLPMTMDWATVPKLGIIPKYAKDEREMWWVDVPGLNIVHIANAWEENGGQSETIVLVASNVYSDKIATNDMHFTRVSFELVEIKVKEKTVRRRPLTSANMEFPVINSSYAGKKNRYVYVGVGPSMPKFSGVAKLDLSLVNSDSHADCMAARHFYPPGIYGGEPYFVAKDPDHPTSNEDEGYILNIIHDENSGESKFIIMDALSPSLEIVASIKLPQRVPYGFHGIFVPQ